jgi:hypothetical protein
MGKLIMTIVQKRRWERIWRFIFLFKNFFFNFKIIEENKINEIKKDEKEENKNEEVENDEELVKIDEETNKNNLNSSKASTLSICSSTSSTSLATTIRRLSPPLNLNNNNELTNYQTSSGPESHFNNYRNKPPSLASEDDEGRNVMFIRNVCIF